MAVTEMLENLKNSFKMHN